VSFYLGSTSLDRCKHVDPHLLTVVEYALSLSPVDFGFSEEQSRTAEEQAAKYKAGVSRVKPGPDARHMIQTDGFSKAVDCVAWIDGKFQWGDSQWRVTTHAGVVLRPYFDIAAAMRTSSIVHGLPMRWGGVWDRALADLPETAAGIQRAMDDYKVRHVGSDLLDGVHFEIAK
jgi:peptidoglycan L-alanyl-D-glutamate endopeptidase CwlK